MVKRIALAFGGGSFANDYARQWTERNLIEALMALTDADILALLNERIAMRYKNQKFREELAAALRENLAASGRRD